MLDGYKSPKPTTITSKMFEYKEYQMTTHDKVISKNLANILINSNEKHEDEMLKLEQEAFAYLISHKDTQERIKHMFYKKAKLHN